MNYLSVCSGIEAATRAWKPLGWRAIAFSEIDKFPSAVLQHYYPEIPNLGDLTAFKEWPHAAPDVLVGGTPCQAFSVAGLREGLADPRGNLTLTYLAVAARYRPRWLVWENVPGVLSDKTGAFGSLLGGLAELGYGWAYRVLDAQYFRVAQRRERVFVVASLGGWACAGAVLFERASLQGHPAPRREAGKETTAGTLRSTDGGLDCDHGAANHLIAHALRGEGFDASEDGTGRGIPLVAGTMKACAESGGFSNSADHAAAGYIIPEVCGALTDGAHNGGGLNGQDAYTGRIIPFVQNQRDELRTLEIAGALASESGMKQQTYLAHLLRVRRLTPRECERLQGFPDDFTLIPYRGKLAKDGPRYKAIGNSMAVPVMRWIGERIAAVEQIRAAA